MRENSFMTDFIKDDIPECGFNNGIGWNKPGCPINPFSPIISDTRTLDNTVVRDTGGGECCQEPKRFRWPSLLGSRISASTLCWFLAGSRGVTGVHPMHCGGCRETAMTSANRSMGCWW